MLHFFVTAFWLVCVHIFSSIFIFVSFHAIATILYCHLPYVFSMQFQEVMHAETSCGLWF